MEYKHLSIINDKLYIQSKFICLVSDLTSEKFKELEDKYTNNFCDYKALSHAYRIIHELEELLETGSIKFPLAYADKIKEIKYNKMSMEEYQEMLEMLGAKVDNLIYKIQNSKLQDEVQKDLINEILLKYLKWEKK